MFYTVLAPYFIKNVQLIFWLNCISLPETLRYMYILHKQQVQNFSAEKLGNRIENLMVAKYGNLFLRRYYFEIVIAFVQ